MQQPGNDDDRFIAIGSDPVEYDPNQTEIPVEPPQSPSDRLKEYLNANFPNAGGAVGGQWRGEHIWVEYGAGGCTVWNAKDMRYVHWRPTKPFPESVDESIEWLEANKDVPQVAPDYVLERAAGLAEMWENNARNPANQSANE